MQRGSTWSYAAISLALVGVALSQSIHRSKSIVINGHRGTATVYEIDGKSFVDLETLIRISSGSMSFGKDEIVLTIPSTSVTAAPSNTEAPQMHTQALSQDFMRSAVQELAIVKDWTNVMAYAVQRGVPGDGARMQVFRDRAAEAVRLAKVAAQTDSDQSALVLLTNHFQAVSGWTDKLVHERRSMDTGKYSMSENALKEDQDYQKISNCANFLSTMIPSGSFQDDSSCH